MIVFLIHLLFLCNLCLVRVSQGGGMVTVCHYWLSLSGVVVLVQQLPTCLNPKCYILANIPGDALALLSPYTGGDRSDMNKI